MNAIASSCVRRNSFTLVESLVTLCILAVLGAVTLPALGRARRSGRAAVCLSNLRQPVAARAAYSGTDEKSQIPPAHQISDVDLLHHDGRYEWGGATGQSNGWNGRYQAGGPRAAETRPLNRVQFGASSATTDHGVFRCPDDNGPTDGWPEENWWWTADFYRRPYFVSVGTSYLGSSLRNHGWNGMQIAPPVEIVGVFLRPASRIPAPGQTAPL